MYKYEYVRYEPHNNVIFSAEGSGHREIIDEMAKNGWRYQGYIPVKQGASGKAVVMDLIFEMEV